MSRNLLCLIATLLAFCLPTIAQAKGWRGIVPLKSTRADVERLLGLPGKHGRYQFETERAYIDYRGTGPCAPENACLCTAAEDTVLSINVELEVEMRFSALKLDKKKYKKFVSPQDRTVATYSNHNDGIIYTIDEKHDDVTAIEYLPSAKDCEQALKRQKRSAKRPAKTSSNHPLLTSVIYARRSSAHILTMSPAILPPVSGAPSERASIQFRAGLSCPVTIIISNLVQIYLENSLSC